MDEQLKQFTVSSVCGQTVPYPSCGPTSSLLSADCAGRPYPILHVAPLAVYCQQFVPADCTLSFLWLHK